MPPHPTCFELRQSVELHAAHTPGNAHNQEVVKLFGILHLPEHVPPPFPVVVMVHGLAGTKVGRHRLYVRLAEKLSKMGIATFRLDMRGCGDSEGDFTQITIDSQVHDVLLGLEFLANHPLICKEHIGILGRSMGGAISVLVAEQLLKRDFMTPACMALWCPLFSAQPWAKEWQKMQQMRQAELSYAQTHPQDGVDGRTKGIPFQGELVSQKLLEELFALNLTPALHTLRHLPFFFAHSINDPVVPVQQTHQYLEQRQATHGEVTGETRFCPFYGKDHEFSLPDEQVDLLEESAKWFQHNLCGQKKHTYVTQKSL